MRTRHAIDVQVMPSAPTTLRADRLAALADFALRAEGVEHPVSLSVAIVDDSSIQRLHARHMGLDTPTDVLTFPYADDGFVSGEAIRLLGDVIVSHETAADQAVAAGHDAAREVEFLVVHGVLHLLGYEDAVEGEREAMLERQSALLAAFEVVRA